MPVSCDKIIWLNNRGVAQIASALAWGARGRRGGTGHPDSTYEGSNFGGRIRYTIVSLDVCHQ